MKLRRWFLSGAAFALAVGSSASGALPASAAVQRPLKIGVDNAAPGGHNWLFVDFFPRRNVKVHKGDVLDFSWNKGSLDGLHTVAFLPAGTMPQPLVAPDADDGPSQIQANPLAFAPSDPTCGTSANPCDFNGSSRVTSGALATAPGNDFFVKVDVAATDDPVTVNYVCEIHPGMAGSITVVPNRAAASTRDQVQDLAAAQKRADTEEALEAERKAERDAVIHNSDDTHTVTVFAGTATPFVEVSEMLPRTVRIEPGDTVKYVTRTIRDVHTVTFPRGAGSNGVDPLVSLCEANPNDTPATSPFDCSNPSLFETHLNPQPQGSTSIAFASTVGSSGVLANPPAPFPNNFAFSFPNAGRFAYQCRIHDHMVGTVVVAQEHED